MRTKFFLAFLFIIFLALLSNIVFEKLIIRDFNDYARGTREDHIYWIMASVEGTYHNGKWDMLHLSESLHWALMLGVDAYIEDTEGNSVLSSTEVYAGMGEGMLKRMNSLLELPGGVGEYMWYPLYVRGEAIGRLYVRPVKRRGLIPEREEIFRKRGMEFLIISFLIAGGGALALSIVLTLYLSNPIRRLRVSAEKIARGDYVVPGPKKRRFFRDELDNLADTFNYMAEALRREDSLRKHLTSNIAHELRTPLTIIRGNLDAMEDGIFTDPKHAIATISPEIDRLIGLVEGIEDLTRAEASFFKKGQKETIDLREFVEVVAGSMRKIIEDKGLYLYLQGDALTVYTYPEKLNIIIKNLMTNALKFTESGGIEVKWGQEDNADEDSFVVSVSDTGRGMTEDEMSKVFQRFYKSADSGGKGLGLAIVKELVEVTGGEIELDSAPGSGSRFTVRY